MPEIRQLAWRPIAVLILHLAIATPGASAEEAAPPEPTHKGVENITVTAQKREQTLQDVPASVSALSGSQLDQSGITQLQDVAFQVPNLHWGQEQGSAKITIRGVASAQGTDQSTAFHIDGIYQNRASSLTSLTFFDVHRVEVLRGPQGTLYGRNATGGAINVISNPPSHEFEVFGDAQFGTYSQKLARGVLNVPLARDIVALRVSGYVEKREGYQKNGFLPGPQDDADDADDFGIRSQLLITPLESVDATLRFHYLRKRGVGYALKREGPLPPFVTLPVIGPQPIYAGATQNPANARHVFLDRTGSIDNESIGGNADVSWYTPRIPLLGETRLRLLGSYVEHDEANASDQDHSDVFIATLDQSQFEREWVTELNWSSEGRDDFGLLLGVFHLGSQGTNFIDAPSRLLGFNLGVKQFFETESYSVAGFVNGWYALSDDLRLEAGFRYSQDWKESAARHPESRIPVGPAPGLLIFGAVNDPRSDDWSRPSGSLSLDYRISEGSIVYGRFSTGYKSGALNNDIAILGGAIAAPPDAGLEDLYALELGSKNQLLDTRLFANLTFFVYWYDDLQVSQLFQAQNIIQNAASARSLGVEWESIYRPWDPLTLTLQFAYLHAEYTRYPFCIDAKDFSVQDCTGNRLSRAPRLSGSVIAVYEIDLRRFGTLSPFFQAYASDDVFFRPTNEPQDTQDAYWLLNFRLMWQSAGGRVGVDLFVDNALDEDVATTKIVGSTLLGAPLLNAYDRPRTAGVRVSLAF